MTKKHENRLQPVEGTEIKITKKDVRDAQLQLAEIELFDTENEGK
jgi:hypothetical protein